MQFQRDQSTIEIPLLFTLGISPRAHLLFLAVRQGIAGCKGGVRTVCAVRPVRRISAVRGIAVHAVHIVVLVIIWQYALPIRAVGLRTLVPPGREGRLTFGADRVGVARGGEEVPAFDAVHAGWVDKDRGAGEGVG